MTTATQTLRDLAQAYLADGISLVPCDHTTKLPEFNLLPKGPDGKATWKPYQTKAATAETVDQWFARGCQSVAAVGGLVSGGLLIVDFDEARFFDAWYEKVAPLPEGLAVQKTGREGGGYQVYLRCPEPGTSDKLAWVADATTATGRKCTIETKAEGGYALMPGSLHPSGRLYECIWGDFASIGTFSQEVADRLLEAARSLDECPKATKQQAHELTAAKLQRLKKEVAERAGETCEKNKAASNGQASVIDEYNQRVTIEAELAARGYNQQGNKWRRPGGVHYSVNVAEGKSFHHSTNDPLCDGYWHRPFDVYCALEHVGKCGEAVKSAALYLGIKLDKAPQTKPQTAPGGTEGDSKPIEFRRISCQELDSSEYGLEYLIDGFLVARQPCVLAGGKKTLKTSLLIDLGISLAMGGYFLGRLKVNRACRVGIMTGESGLATIQETARRIAQAAGHRLGDVEGLVFSEDLPQFGSIAHQEALGRFIAADGLEVIAVDPAYMAIPEVDHANIFSIGPVLRGVSQVCEAHGAMLMIAHHAKKTKADPFCPMELEDISWAGFQEFARQWLLVGRRELYVPGTGEHRLWLSAGGSAGHGDLWAVDVAEGTRATDGGRFWQVDVKPATEARQDADERQADAKRQRADERVAAALEGDRTELVKILTRAKAAQTKSDLRGRFSGSFPRFNRAFLSLAEDGTFQSLEVVKGNNRPYEAWKLRGT